MIHKVLLLSRSVPPAATGSAAIVGALAKQFGRHEMVVAGEKPSGVPPVRWDEEWPRLIYVSRGLAAGIRGARWLRRLQIPAVVARCARIAKREGCGSVLAVFPPADFLLAGWLVARHSGARLYPYMHNTYVENRTGGSRRFAQWLQARVFADAAHVFVMSEGMRTLYAERYPELGNCSALVHSFNEPLPVWQMPPRSRSPLRLILQGSITEACLDATRRMVDAVRRIPDAELEFVSGTPRAVLERWGLLGGRISARTISRDELIGHLRGADVVLLPHGFTGGYCEAEYRTIFPTRTIENLLCGTPLVAHTPPGAFLTQFLREWDCALVVESADTDAVRQAILRVRDDVALRARITRNARAAVEMFYGPRVAGELRAHLARSCEAARTPAARSGARVL